MTGSGPTPLADALVTAWCVRNRRRTIDALCDYVRCETVTPHEERGEAFVTDYLASAGCDVWRAPIHSGVAGHHSVSPHPRSTLKPGRANLRARRADLVDCARSVLFSCHGDVVPAAPGFPHAFDPVVADDRVIGRGACDTKGNLVMLVEAMRCLGELGVAPTIGIEVDVPIEEEVGGNGTLSTVLHGVSADEVVVLEPTGCEVHLGHRGCLTVEIHLVGQPAHMGSSIVGRSAIEGALEVISHLRGLESEMLREARLAPAFARWDRPVGVNIGMIRGGEMSGTTPAACELVADIGFLPGPSLAQVEQLVVSAVRKLGDDWMREHLLFAFDRGLRNEAFLQRRPGALARELMDVIEVEGGAPQTLSGWKVSCDARHFALLSHRPTAIFGCGHLEQAHTTDEYLELGQLELGIRIMTRFLARPRDAHPADALDS